MTDKICFIKDCDYPVRTRGMCQTHYNRWYSGKLKVTPPAPMSPEESGRIGGTKTFKSGHLLKVGFASNKERARIAGAKGGRISRRSK